MPYGYKTFTTNGLTNETDVDLDTSTGRKTMADNTQDTLAVDTKNKWLQIEVTNDKIELAHEIHDFDTNSAGHTNLNRENGAKQEDNLTIYDWDYDNAGHITKKKAHTYTLPYGFKTITTNGRGNDTDENAKGTPSTSSIIADTTQDSLAIDSGNKWIRIDTDTANDIITIRHDIHDTSSTDHTTDWTKTEKNTTIPTVVYTYDKAGHYVSHHTENYKLPFGYGKITGDSGSTEATATFDELTISADDNWIATTVSDDQVNITHTEPVVTSVTNKSNIVDPNFGSTFTIEDWYFDARGHKHTGKTHTVQFPKGSLNDLTATGSSVLTGISMIPETGAITQSHNDVGKLALTGYTASNDRTDIGSGDTINSAFAKLQNQISYEESRINTILNGTDDLTNTLDTFIELQTYITEHGKEAADMAKAISDEANRAKAAESALDIKLDGEIARAKQAETINANAIATEELRATAAETDLSTELNNEIARAQTAENNLNTRINNLGTAANKNVEYFALAGSYDDRVTSEEYEAKIQELQNTISNLEARIVTLEGLSIEATLASLEARIAALEPEPDPEVTVEGE